MPLIAIFFSFVNSFAFAVNLDLRECVRSYRQVQRSLKTEDHPLELEMRFTSKTLSILTTTTGTLAPLLGGVRLSKELKASIQKVTGVKSIHDAPWDGLPTSLKTKVLYEIWKRTISEKRFFEETRKITGLRLREFVSFRPKEDFSTSWIQLVKNERITVSTEELFENYVEWLSPRGQALDTGASGLGFEIHLRKAKRTPAIESYRFSRILAAALDAQDAIPHIHVIHSTQSLDASIVRNYYLPSLILSLMHLSHIYELRAVSLGSDLSGTKTFDFTAKEEFIRFAVSLLPKSDFTAVDEEEILKNSVGYRPPGFFSSVALASLELRILDQTFGDAFNETMIDLTEAISYHPFFGWPAEIFDHIRGASLENFEMIKDKGDISFESFTLATLIDEHIGGPLDYAHIGLTLERNPYLLVFLEKDKSSDSFVFSDDFVNAVIASPSINLLMVPWRKLIYIDAFTSESTQKKMTDQVTAATQDIARVIKNKRLGPQTRKEKIDLIMQNFAKESIISDVLLFSLKELASRAQSHRIKD